MKQTIMIRIILTIFFGLAVPALAQDPPEDPFGGGFPINYDAELFSISADDSWLNGETFDFNPEDTSIVRVTVEALDESHLCGNIRDVATGDFDGDYQDEVVVAWNRPDSGIFVGIPSIDPGTMVIDPDGWYVPDPVGAAGALYATPFFVDFLGEIRVVAGNFYENSASEFVLAYLAADSTVTLSVFVMDTVTQTLIEKDIISDQAANTDVAGVQRFGTIARFDVATGDFDGDGLDEIVLAVNDPDQSPETDLMVNVYDYDTTSHTIVPVSKNSITANSDINNTCLRRVLVTTGNFDTDSLHEVAILDSWARTDSDSARIGSLHTLEFDEGMTNIVDHQTTSAQSLHWEQNPGMNGDVNTLHVYNGDLIAGGTFTTAGGVTVNRIARWDGSNWNALGGGLNDAVHCLYSEEGGNLIAAGNFRLDNPISYNSIARWNGSSWIHMNSMMEAWEGIYALAKYDGELIAGGLFNAFIHYIARYDGSTWWSLGGDILSVMGNTGVRALTVYNDELIIGGDILAAGLLSFNIIRWNGSNWLDFGTYEPVNSYVYALLVYDGKLIVGGNFTLAGGATANHIVSWNGSSWEPLGSGMNGAVHALTEYNGDLIAGGDFTTAGGVSASRIARWDGSNWYPLGSGTNGTVKALTTYEGELIAGGSFTTDGDIPSNHIAWWDGAKWHPVEQIRQFPMDIAAGDLDRDNTTNDNVVTRICTDFSGTNGQYVGAWGFESDLNPCLIDTFELAYDPDASDGFLGSRRSMALGEITGEERVDLALIHSDTTDEKRIEVYEFFPNSVSVCEMDSLPMRGSWTSVIDDLTELVIADFDTFTVTVGAPVSYQIDSIIQPLAIINAPPVHYDILDDTAWDISNRYPIDPETPWDTYVKYIYKEEYGITTSTEMYRDWGISAGLEAWFNGGGLDISTYLQSKYGERFSIQGGYMEEIKVAFEIVARDDDQLHAIIVDYDILEYPVFRNGQLVGHIVVATPGESGKGWDMGKSYKSFLPNHEVENILSYPREVTDNAMMASGIIGDAGQFFTMQPGSGSEWYLCQTTFENSQITESWDWSFEAGGSAGYSVDVEVNLFGFITSSISWGFKASLAGYYGKGQISTFSTSFSEKDSLRVVMGLINSGGGSDADNRRYKITPYAYWANSGALVLDYAVKPDENAPGYDGTWWQNHYSNPDPAFILPWRLINEKWEGSDPPDSRYQTKEIIFTPSYPVPGDTVLISARIHNFSLSPTPDPIGVSFYIGDPDNGGELLFDKNSGDSIFYGCDGDGFPVPIDRQGSAIASMVWQVPYAGDISSCQRIWAHIDPLDSISPEVHDNGDWATNNKGWNLLRVNTDAICVDTDGDGWADPAYRCHICPQPGYDNCPDVPNPDQADNNGDGIGDACEEIIFVCGDANGDQGVNVGDAVYLLNYVFRSGECATNPPIGCPPDYLSAGDANGDTNVNIGDVVYLNNFIFNPSQCATNPPIGCPPTCGS